MFWSTKLTKVFVACLKSKTLPHVHFYCISMIGGCWRRPPSPCNPPLFAFSGEKAGCKDFLTPQPPLRGRDPSRTISARVGLVHWKPHHCLWKVFKESAFDAYFKSKISKHFILKNYFILFVDKILCMFLRNAQPSLIELVFFLNELGLQISSSWQELEKILVCTWGKMLKNYLTLLVNKILDMFIRNVQLSLIKSIFLDELGQRISSL